MAKVLYAGGELDSVVLVGSATASEVTTANTFDSAYARCALSCATSSDGIRMPFIDATNAAVTVVSGETLYLHVDVHAPQVLQVFNLIRVLDASGNQWLALRGTGTTGVYGLFYNSGTSGSPVWTQIGSFTWTNPGSTRTSIDIKLTLGSPHSAELIAGGSSVGSGTFTQASFTAAGFAECYGANASNVARFSQLMATEGLSTIGGKVFSRTASGAGTTNAWTGVFGNVNETPLSDATVLTSGTANQLFTFAYGDTTTPSGFAIKSVFQWTRLKNDGVAPVNFKAACRSNGTDYLSSSNLSGITTSFAPIGTQWAVNPDNSAIWTDTTFNAAEFGGKSIT